MNSEIKQKSVFWILFMGAIGIVATVIIAVVGLFIDGGTISLFLAIAVLFASQIYPLVKMSQMVNEINIMCADDGEHLMHYVLAFLLGCITLGIYYYYYMYRIQNRLYANKDKYNVAIAEKGSSVLLWLLLGILTFGICFLIAQAIPIRNFNKMACAYNKAHGFKTDSVQAVKQKESAQANAVKKVEKTAPSAKYTLVFAEGVAGDPAIGGQIRLMGGDRIVIGRDPQLSQFVVKDTTVSRKHCSIRVSSDGSRVYVTDHSSNGTYINDSQKLIKDVETAISKGDALKLSKHTVFTIQ